MLIFVSLVRFAENDSMSQEQKRALPSAKNIAAESESSSSFNPIANLIRTLLRWFIEVFDVAAVGLCALPRSSAFFLRHVDE